MLLPLKDAIAALKDEVRADRISHAIPRLVPRFLLWYQHNRAEVVLLTRSIGHGRLIHCAFDVAPNIRCVVAVEVDDCFRELPTSHAGVDVLIGTTRMAVVNPLFAVMGDTIEVLFVSRGSNNVDHFVERNLWVLF